MLWKMKILTFYTIFLITNCGMESYIFYHFFTDKFSVLLSGTVVHDWLVLQSHNNFCSRMKQRQYISEIWLIAQSVDPPVCIWSVHTIKLSGFCIDIYIYIYIYNVTRFCFVMFNKNFYHHRPGLILFRHTKRKQHFVMSACCLHILNVRLCQDPYKLWSSFLSWRPEWPVVVRWDQLYCDSHRWLKLYIWMWALRYWLRTNLLRPENDRILWMVLC